jgi:hypothetical protein
MVRMNGRDRVLGLGASIEIPAGRPHRHYAAGSGDAHVRVVLRPALRVATGLPRGRERRAAGAGGASRGSISRAVCRTTSGRARRSASSSRPGSWGPT